MCVPYWTLKDLRERSLPILPYPSVSGPFQRINIDILGPLGIAKSGVTHLVVAVDSFTKWVEAEAFKGAPSATDMNQFFMRHFINRHNSAIVMVYMQEVFSQKSFPVFDNFIIRSGEPKP